jgi:hypothetical protein
MEILRAPFRLSRGDDERWRDFRLMGFAASLATLVMLATPWLTIWDDGTETPTGIYSGIGMIELQQGMRGPDSPLRGLGTFLFLVYLLMALVCLLFPATIAAVVCSCSGSVVTVVIIMINLESVSASWSASNVHQVDWTGAPTVAVGIWLVAAFVAAGAWSARRR